MRMFVVFIEQPKTNRKHPECDPVVKTTQFNAAVAIDQQSGLAPAWTLHESH